MININVLFFGATAEEVGKREVGFEFAETLPANEVFAQILSAYPQLEKHSLFFAVNEQYSNGNELIKNGDELAIFTAVSGG